MTDMNFKAVAKLLREYGDDHKLGDIYDPSTNNSLND